MPVQNRLLAALPAEDFERLRPHLEVVRLLTRQTVYKSREPITHLYFPQMCMVSLVALADGSATVEVATVGNDGVVGLPIFLGADRIVGQAVCQIPGPALRIEAGIFREQMGVGSRLHALLQAYTLALLTLIAQTAACNRLHSMAQRCARWLLMTHDRVGVEEFPLTQEFLAQMLGVRRASVTGAAGVLQKAGWIQYRRGQITVVDRAGLETACCECYRIITDEFDRLFAGV
ncbi:MAG TPA: Crp/Fnr family transcriptional regulator [Chloroflexota bacterium]|nr:Crp/Fnr family transcriptional regulator [Chloroflexota bacterium]